MKLASLWAGEPPILGRLVDEDAVAEGSTLPTAVWESALWAPVREILERPAKGFRAHLAETCFSLVERGRRPPAELGAALEILHAGSLIVDDIEDGSVERRGGPALHRLFGLARALNAGNFMYFWALDRLARLPIAPEASALLGARALRTLLECHRGQALDLELVVGRTPQTAVRGAVEETTALKTGSLVSLAAFAGVTAAGGDAEQREAAARFGVCFGRGLQKLDDLGNLSARREPAKRHEDLRAGRLTWPWVWAAESLAPADFARLEAEARALAAPGIRSGVSPGCDDKRSTRLADELRAIAGPLRRGQIVAEIHQALDELEQVFGRSEITRGLGAQASRLGVSYG